MKYLTPFYLTLALSLSAWGIYDTWNTIGVVVMPLIISGVVWVAWAIHREQLRSNARNKIYARLTKYQAELDRQTIHSIKNSNHLMFCEAWVKNLPFVVQQHVIYRTSEHKIDYYDSLPNFYMARALAKKTLDKSQMPGILLYCCEQRLPNGKPYFYILEWMKEAELWFIRYQGEKKGASNYPSVEKQIEAAAHPITTF